MTAEVRKFTVRFAHAIEVNHVFRFRHGGPFASGKPLLMQNERGDPRRGSDTRVWNQVRLASFVLRMVEEVRLGKSAEVSAWFLVIKRCLHAQIIELVSASLASSSASIFCFLNKHRNINRYSLGLRNSPKIIPE